MDNGLTWTPYKNTHFLLKNVPTGMDYPRKPYPRKPYPWKPYPWKPYPIWTIKYDKNKTTRISTALDTTNMLCLSYKTEASGLECITCFLKIAPKSPDLQMCQINTLRPCLSTDVKKPETCREALHMFIYV